jgi:tRNA 2-selenouridine synthase
MPIYLAAEAFLRKAERGVVIDVRSPAEFFHAHIPGSHSLPLFSDEERARVGTAYKQLGKKEAVMEGFGLVGPKMQYLAEEGIRLAGSGTCVFLYCWRGGMRSNAMAFLLEKAGLEVFVLEGGYKSYRQWVRETFLIPFPMFILGGETGSGKTRVLKCMKDLGSQTIDLEFLARHKGSAFGSLENTPQPDTEQFENNLAAEIRNLNPSLPVWVEDESHTIGKVHVPDEIWFRMKKAPIFRLSVPREERIKTLMREYGVLPAARLEDSLTKIRKRLGYDKFESAIQDLQSGNLESVCRIVLDYYDKAYNYNHEKREWKDVFFVEGEGLDDEGRAKKILAFSEKMNSEWTTLKLN